MKKSEASFLQQLEDLGLEQARISSSSPLPEWSRPVARIVGERPFPTLFFGSLIVAIFISTWFFPVVQSLFEKGVLAWILR